MSDKQGIISYSVILQRSETEYERKVTSIVADPLNIDSYGGSIRPEVIQRAADDFMEYFRNVGTDHLRDSDGNVINQNDKIALLENWVSRNDQEIDGQFVPKGAWIQTWRINDDEMWDKVLRGDLTGFSFVAITKKVKVE